MIPLLMILTIDGPLHRIHGEMVSNAIHQGASRVVVVAQGPDAPAAVAMRLPGIEVTAKAPLEGVYYRLTIRERIVSAMLLPERAFVALAAGMLLIFAEFCFPGTVLPGALGGVIAMTALYGGIEPADVWHPSALGSRLPVRCFSLQTLACIAGIRRSPRHVHWRDSAGGCPARLPNPPLYRHRNHDSIRARDPVFDWNGPARQSQQTSGTKHRSCVFIRWRYILYYERRIKRTW